MALKSSRVCCPPNLHDVSMGSEGVDMPVGFFQTRLCEMSFNPSPKPAWSVRTAGVDVKAGLESMQSKVSNHDGHGIFQRD